MYHRILSRAKYHKIYDQAKTLVVLLIMLFAYGTIGFSILKRVDLPSGFVHTVEALEFIYTPETDPTIRTFQSSLVIFGGVFLWFALWTLFEFIFKGKLVKYFIEVIHLLKAGKATNHVIICGGGRVGNTLAQLLVGKGNKVVIIEKDANTAHKLRGKFTVINGDALNEEILKEANIEKAKVLVAAISSGEKNVLLTLEAKQLNPKIEVLARSDEEMHVKKLKSVGATHVIMPEIAGAKELYSLLK